MAEPFELVVGRTDIVTPTEVRHWLAPILKGLGLDGAADDILVVVSELVTNVVVHAPGPCSVSVQPEPTGLRIAVADSSTSLPVSRPREPGVPGGFGLPIVEALSDRWGVASTDSGKETWVIFETS